MGGAAALLAAYSPAFGQEQEEGMVLRRPPNPGEDPDFFRYGQPGKLLPTGQPVVIEYENVRVMVNFPRYTRKSPLIVFSHGALADPQIYRQLIDHWVSNGFTVASPIHDDSVFERGLLARHTANSGQTDWDMDSVLNDSDAWDARCEACRLPLNHVDRISATLDMELNIDRPIIIGHEFGAFVAQLLLGTKVTVDNGKRRTFLDARWSAACLLSPQGAGIMGLDDTSWDDVERPFMVVQGGSESDFTGQDPMHKIEIFEKAKPGNKHLAWFKDGDRLMFSGPRAGTKYTKQAEFEAIEAITACWLDAYGNYNQSALDLLVSDWAERASLGVVVTRYR